ncbi:cation-translocating P-type ATPase [Sporosarcina sp. P29]|uniref:cation-translocating P-type ATPase n=1 Tax=Sporosarcina sp. P29 TaxID=2048252 RepID=UPI000C16CAAC|nr:cation-translocating P-type ATPase [Sporosarcina sp. P29]PIC98293.1 ATPase [Sporosarcina sp. P29]
MPLEKEKQLTTTDPLVGLSEEEVQKRVETFGANKLASAKSRSLLKRIFSQINNVLIYLLIVAAVISGLLGEFVDSIIIGLVIVINAMVGLVQESKAEDALEALKSMATPNALVRRDGVQREIPSEHVVPGDVVLLDAGRYVPCDMQLIESVDLKIDEAALTGESVPVEKDAGFTGDLTLPIGDQKNMAFMSTLTTYGRATGIAVETGMTTEIGKVAAMLDNDSSTQTPLQQSLAQLGKYLSIAAIVICVLIFGIGMLQGRDLLDMFMLSVSLAVAAIPEGMPAIVSIVLAIGVQRMIRQHVIIRNLPAVEALGSVNVICSDKTGTLTQNKMTVTHFFADGHSSPLVEASFENPVHQLLFENITLCNDATFSNGNETGDPTEIALLVAAYQYGLNRNELYVKHPRLDEIPFDSGRKLMTTVHTYDRNLYTHTKGAIDGLLAKCTQYETAEGTKPMDEDHKNLILEHASKLSNEALRVLGCAYKKVDSAQLTNHGITEDNLIFIGLVGMIDPPREEVKEAIQVTKRAGIRTVMITGDHRDTAFAIAKELGIANDKSEVIDGEMIESLTEVELNEKSSQLNVYARVSPEHKVKIVQALKAKGNTVSMTGDGVNDAPSLKSADIGVAMGITGTDVAKGASDMILTDDNFGSIVKAVEEGRTIYRNIKKAIIFLLSCNLGEIIALFTAILLGWPVILRPVHILWINLVTDSFPALSLGVDPEEADVMSEKPRHRKESIFHGMIAFLILNGLLIGAVTLVAFAIGIYSSGGYSGSVFSMNTQNISDSALMHGQTMAFLALSFSQLIHSLNFRSINRSVFKAGIFKNKYLIYSILLGVVLQVAIVSIGPFAKLFSVNSLGVLDWLIICSLSILPLLLNEVVKLIKR